MPNLEYYVMDTKYDETYPTLAARNECPHTYDYVVDCEKIDNPETSEFQFRHPIPRKPVFGDYFDAQSKPVVSEKIKFILEPLNLPGVQFIPAKIYDNKGNIHENYFFMNIYNLIMAVDRENSKYRTSFANDPDCLFLDRFSLNKKVLENIPLDERLIFLLKENKITKIVHSSIVQLILKENPKGIGFTLVEDWHN